MTQKNPTDVERLALKFKCPQCGQPAFVWCRTFTGKLYARLHVTRLRPATYRKYES